MSLRLEPGQLRPLFDVLLDRYGPQHWWPAESPFEMMAGAILTQNTAWSNVSSAIENLRQAQRLSLPGMLRCPAQELALLIRPAGYFNLKADRLLQFCRFLHRVGGEPALARLETPDLRTALLGVKGIGPETADDILLYAFQRPCFVIDAYTRRILSRFGLIKGDEPYESLRLAVEHDLGEDVPLYNEAHALIVRHAKVACTKRPQCGECCLAHSCNHPR